jgi:hypothetical protein
MLKSQNQSDQPEIEKKTMAKQTNMAESIRSTWNWKKQWLNKLICKLWTVKPHMKNKAM